VLRLRVVNYRGSYRKLQANSRAALLGSIEIYNKPRFQYRDEVFVILLVNAWELLLKALVSKGGRSIYYPKKRGEPYRTLGALHALQRAVSEGIWPASLPHQAFTQNLSLLIEFRDKAVHFYNAKGFGILVYSLAQTSIVNYRDLMREAFNEDIADGMTWRLMPLGIEPPVDPLQYLRGARQGGDSEAVDEFVASLSQAFDILERANIDTGRVLTIFDVKLQSTKKLEKADLVANLDPGEENAPQIIERRVTPSDSHPLLPKAVVEAVGELHARKFAQFDLTALERHFGWREKPHLCYDDPETNRVRWSTEIVSMIRKVSSADFDAARTEYAAERQRIKEANARAKAAAVQPG
jgi:hypothetical protein